MNRRIDVGDEARPMVRLDRKTIEVLAALEQRACEHQIALNSLAASSAVQIACSLVIPLRFETDRGPIPKRTKRDHTLTVSVAELRQFLTQQRDLCIAEAAQYGAVLTDILPST